ncbi:hypothetical protein HYV74_02025 [Candidatus Uhrbacteria bacterium]|nr:hypothetical protein [Candidatus Uhrbacteria bacterium]
MVTLIGSILILTIALDAIGSMLGFKGFHVTRGVLVGGLHLLRSGLQWLIRGTGAVLQELGGLIAGPGTGTRGAIGRLTAGFGRVLTTAGSGGGRRNGHR